MHLWGVCTLVVVEYTPPTSVPDTWDSYRNCMEFIRNFVCKSDRLNFLLWQCVFCEFCGRSLEFFFAIALAPVTPSPRYTYGAGRHTGGKRVKVHF